MEESPSNTTPKYESVKSYVRHLLDTDVISYGNRLPSEHELRDKFKVSRQTVRQAFGDLESEGLILRHQGKGTFSNYKKGLTQKQIIAVVTPNMGGFIFPSIITGIEEVLSGQGYMMFLSNTNNVKERESQLLKSALQYKVVGAIIEPTKSAMDNSNRELLGEMIKKGIKTVFINACYADFDSSCVLMDDEKGGFMATEHMIQIGHRKIAGIFKTDDIQGVKRKKGYIKALNQHDVNVDASIIGEYASEDMSVFPYVYTQSLLRERDSPTAIVCYNDEIAILVIKAIKDHGLLVPEDISVTGFDDALDSNLSDMKLTTIVHPKKDMGKQAAQFMIDMLSGRMQKPQMVYQPELIVRNSCRRIDREAVAGQLASTESILRGKRR